MPNNLSYCTACKIRDILWTHLNAMKSNHPSWRHMIKHINLSTAQLTNFFVPPQLLVQNRLSSLKQQQKLFRRSQHQKPTHSLTKKHPGIFYQRELLPKSSSVKRRRGLFHIKGSCGVMFLHSLILQGKTQVYLYLQFQKKKKVWCNWH